MPFGPHLVSYRVTSTRRTLLVDGVLVDSAETPSNPVALSPGPEGGPGAVLGHAASNQTSGWQEAKWLRFAPFLFHLRSGVGSFESLELGEVVEANVERTLRLFDANGVMPGGSTWKPSFGTNAAVVVNATWIENINETCL
jgi:hypothetical protein